MTRTLTLAIALIGLLSRESHAEIVGEEDSSEGCDAQLGQALIQLKKTPFLTRPVSPSLSKLIDDSRGQANSSLHSKIHSERSHQFLASAPQNIQPLGIDKVLVYTVETRGDELLRLQGPPGWNWGVRNIGFGKTWGGFQTKFDIVQTLLPTLPDNQLIVIIDGRDVMYGGCDLEDFHERFRLLSSSTGTSVVFGAEPNCYQPPRGGCDIFDSVPHHRVSALKAFNVTQASLDAWADERFPEVKFLNAGFYAGRVKDIRAFFEVVKCGSGCDDQQSFAQAAFLDSREMVTLDYASMLVNNLYGVPLEKNGTLRFSFDEDKQLWMDHAKETSVCFFHGNGNKGKDAFRDYLTGTRP